MENTNHIKAKSQINLILINQIFLNKRSFIKQDYIALSKISSMDLNTTTIKLMKEPKLRSKLQIRATMERWGNLVGYFHQKKIEGVSFKKRRKVRISCLAWTSVEWFLIMIEEQPLDLSDIQILSFLKQNPVKLPQEKPMVINKLPLGTISTKNLPLKIWKLIEMHKKQELNKLQISENMSPNKISIFQKELMKWLSRLKGKLWMK